MSGVSSALGGDSIKVFIQTNLNAGIPPLQVFFTPVVLGGKPPYTFTWDFGDGTPKTNEIAPVHTFTKLGVYQVKLTVTDANNQKIDYTTYINVVDSSWAFMIGARFMRVFPKPLEFIKTGLGVHPQMDGFGYSESIDFGIHPQFDGFGYSESLDIQNS